MLFAPRSCGTRIIRVLFSLSFSFPYSAIVQNFHFPGETTFSPGFTLSPCTQMRGFHFPFATVAVLLSILSPFSLLSPVAPLSTPFCSTILSVLADVRSFARHRFVCNRGPEATLLVLRVTNPRFFRSFFRTKISTFRGETRTRFGGNAEKEGKREKRNEKAR